MIMIDPFLDVRTFRGILTHLWGTCCVNPSNWRLIVKPIVSYYRIGMPSPVPSPWASKQHDLNLMGGIRLNPRLGCQCPARCFEHVPETKPATTWYAHYGQRQWDWLVHKRSENGKIWLWSEMSSIVGIRTSSTKDKPNNTASSTKLLREIPWTGREGVRIKMCEIFSQDLPPYHHAPPGGMKHLRGMAWFGGQW